MHHPSAVLDRAHPRHLEMLRGRGRVVVGRVVREHHEELRTQPHELSVELREAVLEADGSPERREPRRLQGVQPLPRRQLVRDLIEGGDPSDERLPWDVLAVRDEVGLPIHVDHLSPAVEDHRLIEQRVAGWMRRPDVSGRGSGQHRGPDIGDAGADLVEDLEGPRVERALPPDGQVGWIILQRPCRSRFSLVTAMSPSSLEPSRTADRKSTCIAATSIDRPAVTANGMTTGASAAARASADPREHGARARVRRGGLGEQGRRERDDERDAEDARDHGDANGDRVRNLRHAEGAPREPTERPEPTEPIDRGPGGGRAEGGEEWAARSADERERPRRTARSRAR